MFARIKWVLLVVTAAAFFVFLYLQMSYEAVYGRYVYTVMEGDMPAVSAESWMIVALDTGDVLAAHNPDSVVPVASITKLMTAVVVLTEMDSAATTTVSWTAVLTEGRAGRLQGGEEIVVRELLFPLLLESSNDAAEVLAETYGRDAFIAAMNAQAQAWGMDSTSFADPSGLSADNTSTAADLQIMLRRIQSEQPHIFDITKLQTYIGADHTWLNGDQISAHPSFRGGKNGYTDEAGHTFAGIFEVTLSGDVKRPVGIVLLGGTDTVGDSEALIDYTEERVRYEYAL